MAPWHIAAFWYSGAVHHIVISLVMQRQGERFFGPVLDYASTPRADGTSPECTKLCQMVPSCSGYEALLDGIGRGLFRSETDRRGSGRT